VSCLSKDRDALLAFYDFPAEHWGHLRTTNPIESTFATIRLRHRRTKGSGSRKASLTMMFKLAESASRRWRRLERITNLFSFSLESTSRSAIQSSVSPRLWR
jgi:putative transposase